MRGLPLELEIFPFLFSIPESLDHLEISDESLHFLKLRILKLQTLLILVYLSCLSNNIVHLLRYILKIVNSFIQIGSSTGDWNIIQFFNAFFDSLVYFGNHNVKIFFEFAQLSVEVCLEFSYFGIQSFLLSIALGHLRFV